MKNHKPERVPFFHSLSDLKRLKKGSRVYFGHEFCFHMLPTLEEFEQFGDVVRRKNLTFTLVTPYVSESNIKGMKSLMKKADARFPGAEVVVNDWGMFAYLKKSFSFDIILGRILAKQKRGFFRRDGKGFSLVERMDLSVHDKTYLKSSILDNAYTLNFLKARGVKRIGLDNLPSGLSENRASFKVDLYRPYIYMTTSHYCRIYLSKTSKKIQRHWGECPRFCLKETRKTEVCGHELLLKGNTQFYENRRPPRNLHLLKVDRIIEEEL